MTSPATELTREVLDRIAGAPDPRLREVLEAAVRHLHGFARDVGLTPDEWSAGIRFLTSVGRRSEPVTTHLFDAADSYLDSDAVFGVRASLVKEFVPRPDGSTLVEHDFVLRAA